MCCECKLRKKLEDILLDLKNSLINAAYNEDSAYDRHEAKIEILEEMLGQ